MTDCNAHADDGERCSEVGPRRQELLVLVKPRAKHRHAAPLSDLGGGRYIEKWALLPSAGGLKA